MDMGKKKVYNVVFHFGIIVIEEDESDAESKAYEMYNETRPTADEMGITVEELSEEDIDRLNYRDLVEDAEQAEEND
jgi:hypothetical protein